MLSGWFILVASVVYIGLLFVIAYYGDKRSDEGRSLIENPYVYTLSIAVYCTSWTFYGSVGRAAASGFDFLTIYLGPTLVFVLWWFVLRKIIRISKANRITSIADFISSRYGKSPVVSGLVTVIAVVGIMPYISLQLKAVSTSFGMIFEYPEIVMPRDVFVLQYPVDTSFLVAIALTVFAILFGTRHIDASEHHPGLVAVIAFESLLKLFAFVAVGVFVTFYMHDGFADLFSRAAANADFAELFEPVVSESYGLWMTMIILSMAAVICLPRQFQVTVVENVKEDHLRTAAWLFPLYILLINIFVMPIALSGLMLFPDGNVEADTFVLSIPMMMKQEGLALFAFVGGLSAATGMVIVATVALSTMVCNDLVMPVLLRIQRLGLGERDDVGGLLLGIRRGSIILIIALSYVYFKLVGESYALVTTGLVSFAAAAQFAPAIIGGIFWKGATRQGALAGLGLGFAVWVYTLLLPSFARSGWLPSGFMEAGIFGIELLKPYALFGMEGQDPLSHSLFWSMLANVGGFVVISLTTRQDALDRIQSTLFVDVFRMSGAASYWRGSVTVRDLRDLVTRFLGGPRTDRSFEQYALIHGIDLSEGAEANSRFVSFTEQLLAGAIGAASAQVMVATVAKGEIVGIDEVMKILDETSHVIEYSHQLEMKSNELEKASRELRVANEQLKELDSLKDDFISMVSHELRTPLTSIRSFAEILYDNPALEGEKRSEFLEIIIKENGRLTRLINQTLDLTKMEAGRMEWDMAEIDPVEVILDAVAATRGLFSSGTVSLDVQVPSDLPTVLADRDRLVQVIVNLLANAVYFCDPKGGKVRIEASTRNAEIVVRVIDNGPGVPFSAREIIFDKFRQISDLGTAKSDSTGLGLTISRQIVDHFGGRIWVEDNLAGGAVFAFTIPSRTIGQSDGRAFSKSVG